MESETIRRLRAENEELRLRLEVQERMAHLFTDGLPGRAKAEIEELIRERNYWRDLALQTNPFLAEDILRELAPGYQRPTDEELQARSAATGEPVFSYGLACRLAGVLWIKPFDNATIEIKIDSGSYPGTLETFQAETLAALSALIGRTPTLADVGNKKLHGLTADDLLEICRTLTPYHDSIKGKAYEAKRLEQFDKYWPEMVKTEHYQYYKKEARDTGRRDFKGRIDDVFKARDRRLGMGG